jgi:hypothetical protein
MPALPNNKLTTPASQDRASASHNLWLKAFGVDLDDEATLGEGKIRQYRIKCDDRNPYSWATHVGRLESDAPDTVHHR